MKAIFQMEQKNKLRIREDGEEAWTSNKNSIKNSYVSTAKSVLGTERQKNKNRKNGLIIKY